VSEIVNHRRILFLLLGGWLCAHAAFGQAVAPGSVVSQVVSPDRAFATVPFDKWLAEGDLGTFRWSVRVAAGELSAHQRLRAKIELQVDGSDLVNRRGHGFLVMLVQIEDGDHRIYRSHGALDLQQVTEAAAKSDIVYTQDAFVRPGEYRLDLVMFDTKTGEHSALQRKFRANPLRSDPLPAAWNDLPPVEFTAPVEGPDNFFLPYVTGRLQLPLETRRPVRIELLMNASATAVGAAARTGQVNGRSLADLLPALKVVSHVKVRNGTLNVSVLDITRRRVVFEQNALGELDWPQLRTGLLEADPHKIDVRALEHREENAQFFVEQVRERLGLAGAATRAAGEPLRIGIVLSGPMGFPGGENLRPIEAAGGSDRKLFYIRYHSLPPPQFDPASVDPLRGGRRSVTGFPQRPVALEPLDALLSLVKPLQPRVFDVYTPEQFRKALGALLDEISKL
jgi:hypothetical protein